MSQIPLVMTLQPVFWWANGLTWSKDDPYFDQTNTLARASTGPTKFPETWTITRYAVTSTPNSNIANSYPECRVYRTAISPLNFIDGTRSAVQDVSETNITLNTLETLWFVFTQGEPSSYAQVILTGTIETGRRI